MGPANEPQGTSQPWDGLLLIANYNQVVEIEGFLRRVEKHFPKEHCVVVDDGSTDGSPEVAERLGFRLLRHPRNRGIGAAIRTGLQYGLSHGYRWALISSSNGKIRPEDFKTVYGPVQEGRADYVTGSRFMKSGSSPGLPLFRRLAIPAFSWVAAFFLRRRFSDITCGFRAYVLSLLADPDVHADQAWLDRYELEYYLHYKAVRTGRYRVLEVPVTIEYSGLKAGRISKIRPITGWWSMVRPFILLGLGIRR